MNYSELRLTRMNFHKLLSLAIALCSYSAMYCNTWHYNYSLSLVLLRDGVNTFLDKSRTIPMQEFQTAVKDVIDLSHTNNTNTPQILDELETELVQRMRKIELLTASNYDYSISSTLKTFAISAALSLGAYLIYKKWYLSDSQKFKSIESELEAQNIKVTHGFNIYLDIPAAPWPNPLERIAQEKGNRLLEIKRSQDQAVPLILTGIISSCMYFAGGIHLALNIGYDKYLHVYQEQFACIKKLRLAE